MTVDPGSVSLRPMADDEYAAFFERSIEEYTTEIADNLRVSREAARVKAVEDFAEHLPDGLATEDHHLFVIVDGSGADRLGELWIGLQDDLGNRVAFGYDFWVRPELRDQGIGRAVMHLAEARARELGATRLALNVFGDNQRAVHLYSSYGFVTSNTNMHKDL